MTISFENKTVMITGAAGFLGKELAKQYYQSHADKIILVDLKERDDSLRQLQNLYPNTYIYHCDICNRDDIVDLSKKIGGDGHAVDVLINNIGINILRNVDEMDDNTWDTVLNTNLSGNFFITKLIATDSLINAKGNVVFISSQHGIVGNTLRTAYCASKSALIGLVHALVAEWGQYGVRVNAVSPTYILNTTNESYLYSNTGVRKMLSKIPLGKYASYSDVAAAVLFISSDKAEMINGHNLVVDGGYTIL